MSSEKGAQQPVSLITGASSGIGRAMAPLFAAEGHAVALIARRLELLEEVAAEIKSAGGEALAIKCDVTDRAQVHEAVQKTERELGPITRLFANAGSGDYTPAHHFSAEAAEGIIQLNLVGTIYCVAEVLPSMLQRGSGHIVGISSLAGYRGLPRGSAYSASKAGMTNLLESLRIELKPRGIDVTVICPGFVKTPITADMNNPMPFLMELDDAAKKIHRAVIKRKRHYAFPWPMAFAVWFGRLVPTWLYDLALSTQVPKKKKG